MQGGGALGDSSGISGPRGIFGACCVNLKLTVRGAEVSHRKVRELEMWMDRRCTSQHSVKEYISILVSFCLTSCGVQHRAEQSRSTNGFSTEMLRFRSCRSWTGPNLNATKFEIDCHVAGGE